MGRGKSISKEDLAREFGITLEEKPAPKNSYNDNRRKNSSGKPKTTPSSNKGGAPKSNTKVEHFTPATAARASATAPYNFVSLPDKPLVSEISSVGDFKAHIESRGKISGEIELELKTLTPLFIGGNGEVTFAPNGTPIIPGSSLRGMFKNIFKIVTCGTFRGATDSQKKGEDFNDEHVYYRCLMASKNSPDWMKALNLLYKDRMETNGGKDGKPVKNAKPGFLIHTTDDKYFILPATVGDNKNNRISIFDRRFKNLDKSCVLWDGGTAYIFTGKGGKKKFVRFTKIDYVDWKKWLPVTDEVRESYVCDRNRRGVDLLDNNNPGLRSRAELLKFVGENQLKNIDTLIPCHFLEKGGKVTAFGHGQCFRIPYENAIGTHVPAALQSTDVVDFADAVFGREKFWASRVQFEDAVPVSETKPLGKTTQILGQPNPTSYQLYLKQSEGSRLNHWDIKSAQIRGYKMYWHNASENWKTNSTGTSDNENVAKPLTPLAAGATFKAKIRFHNLSAVELGALMMIFDLNGHGANAAYKIGQGKPLGFGSVKIKPTLFVESGDAYAELFADGDWKNPYRTENPDKYLAAFKEYLGAQAPVWKKVMEELNAILSWDKRPAVKQIEAMKGTSDSDGKNFKPNEKFLQRLPLPTILDVVK